MTDYYVRLGGNNANTGLSDAQAFADIAYAEGQAGSGDRVLLRRGDVWGGHSPHNVSTNGVTISTYGSGPKPVLDRGWASNVISGDYASVLGVYADGVTVEDIRLVNSQGIGMRIEGSNFRITGVETDNTFRHGMQVLNASEDGLIEGCTVHWHNRSYDIGALNPVFWGVGLLVSNNSSDQSKRCRRITVRNNLVYEGWGEGIGAYGFCEDLLYEGNISYANRAVGFYFDGFRRITVRNNLAVGTSNPRYHRSGGYCGPAYYVSTENRGYNPPDQISEDFVMVNNCGANCFRGVAIGPAQGLGNGVPQGQHGPGEWRGLQIHHNTFVDNLGQCAKFAEKLDTNNAYTYNTHVSISAGTQDIINPFNSGMVFDRNYWSQGPATGIMNDADDIYSGANLTRTGGWQSATAIGQIVENDFRPLASSSLLGHPASTQGQTQVGHLDFSQSTGPIVNPNQTNLAAYSDGCYVSAQ